MTFALGKHVVASDTESGMVLLDERAGRYWQLNATGAQVLRMLLGGAAEPAAVAELSRCHPAEADRIATDVERLLVTLREAGLVRS